LRGDIDTISSYIDTISSLRIILTIEW
jgi:hypothetical protein